MPDMLVKLYELPEEETLCRRLKEDGVLIRPAMPYEKHAVVEWVRNRFDSCWASECDVAFSRRPVSCFLATEEGRVIGFACHDSTCKGFFGPMGVAEDRRGRGVGKALFLACLCAMAADGYAYAVVGGGGPAGFYARAAGATVIEGSSPGIYRDRPAAPQKTGGKTAFPFFDFFSIFLSFFSCITYPRTINVSHKSWCFMPQCGLWHLIL